MKHKTHHNVKTVPKSIIKIVFSLLGTGTSIKRGGVKPIVCTQRALVL
jgi:hypothetical protein